MKLSWTKTFLVLATIFALAGNAAHARKKAPEPDGQQWVRWNEHERSMVLIGYIWGIMDGWDDLCAQENPLALGGCSNDKKPGFDVPKLSRQITAYFQDHPEDRCEAVWPVLQGLLHNRNNKYIHEHRPAHACYWP